MSSNDTRELLCVLLFVFLMLVNAHWHRLYVTAPGDSGNSYAFLPWPIECVSVCVCVLPNISGKYSTSLFIKRHIRGWHTITAENIVWPMKYYEFHKQQQQQQQIPTTMLPSLSTLNYLKFIRNWKWNGKKLENRHRVLSAWASTWAWYFQFQLFFLLHLWNVKQHPANDWQYTKNAYRKITV